MCIRDRLSGSAGHARKALPAMANVPSIGLSNRCHGRDPDPASGPGHRTRRDQRSLRDALVAGDLDWITCWSSSLRELREKMDGKLALAPLPKGPSTKLKAATKLQVGSTQRHSTQSSARY